MLLGMQNHLQPNKLEGVRVSKNESLNKYQIIKKNVQQGLYILGE